MPFDDFSLTPLRQPNVWGQLFQPQQQSFDPYGDLFGGGGGSSPFGNLFQPSVDFSQPMAPQPIQPMDMFARMQQYYTPETEATKAFNQLAMNFPQREEPSTLRKIGTSLMGLSNLGRGRDNPQNRAMTMQMQEQFMNRPFHEAVSDWKTQAEPLYQAANLERYANANERQLASNMATAQYNTERMALENRKQEERERANISNERIRQQRADVYEFKSRNPNLEIVIPKGGNIYAIDPLTGEKHDLGIPSGSMTDIDRINLQHKMTMGEIGAKGAEARATRAVVPGGAGVNKPLTPDQIKTDQYNRARQLANTDPKLAPFIVPGDRAGEFSIMKPTTGGWFSKGPTQEQYDQIISYIYGSQAGKVVPPSGNVAPTGGPPTGGRRVGPGPITGGVNQPPEGAVGGKVKVVRPDGQVGWIPADRLNAALKAGYKRAQ